MYIVVTAEILNFNRTLRHIGPILDQPLVKPKIIMPRPGSRIPHTLKGILCNYNTTNGDLTNALTGAQVFPVEWDEKYIKEI
jgi:hypothetical protein